MEEQRKNYSVAVLDRPIQKPDEDFPEEFLRSVEKRFVTKRFPKNSTHSRSNSRHSARDN